MWHMTLHSLILSSVNFSLEGPRFFFLGARWRFRAEPSGLLANCIDLPNYDHYATVISSVLSRGREGQISEAGRGDNAARRRRISEDEPVLRDRPCWSLVWWLSPAHASTINLNKNDIKSPEIAMQCTIMIDFWSWMFSARSRREGDLDRRIFIHKPAGFIRQRRFYLLGLSIDFKKSNEINDTCRYMVVHH